MLRSKNIWIKNGEPILYGNIETDLKLLTPSPEKQYLYLAFKDYPCRQNKNKDDMVNPKQFL
jgi:hypothetical protein